MDNLIPFQFIEGVVREAKQSSKILPKSKSSSDIFMSLFVLLHFLATFLLKWKHIPTLGGKWLS